MNFRCPYCGINNIWKRFLDTICIQNKVSKQQPTEIFTQDWDSPPGTPPISPFSFSFKPSLKKDERKETFEKIKSYNKDIDFTSSDEDDWEKIC